MKTQLDNAKLSDSQQLAEDPMFELMMVNFKIAALHNAFQKGQSEKVGLIQKSLKVCLENSGTYVLNCPSSICMEFFHCFHAVAKFH